MDKDREYLVVASRLRLKSFWSTPKFMLYGGAIQWQLAKTAGLVGYSILMEPFRKVYGTLSVWESERDLMMFTKEAPHSKAMEALRPILDGKAVYSRWAVTSADEPPSWELAVKKLSEAEKTVHGITNR